VGLKTPNKGIILTTFSEEEITVKKTNCEELHEILFQTRTNEDFVPAFPSQRHTLTSTTPFKYRRKLDGDQTIVLVFGETQSLFMVE
jgi:hypothetical protein